MNAREVVLGRIRDALTLAPPTPVAIPRDYRTGRTLPDDERYDLFADRLLDYKAQVHRCSAATAPSRAWVFLRASITRG